MQPAPSNPSERRSPLVEWWSAPLGRALLDAEAEVVAEALEDVFGWELLQVGAWGPGRNLLAGARTRRQTVVAGPEPELDPDVIGRPAQLPVAADSMDAVLLPHTLETTADPHSVVREADRVLTGEGQLLILGFRPWSSWGLRSRASHNGFPPGLRRVLPERRVVDWLALLGYEVFARRRYLFTSPWSAAPAPRTAGAGRMRRRGLLNPLSASAYLLKARKRIYTLTPIRPRLREKPQVLGGLVEPTTRQSG